MASSAKTLFSGNNLGLQVYSVVRVFDYITGVLMDFLNRGPLKISINIRRINGADGNSGWCFEKWPADGDFSIKRFEQDGVQRDKDTSGYTYQALLSCKNFMIKMEGKG